MVDAYPRARLAMPGHRTPSAGSLRSGPMRARVGWDRSDTPPALLGLGTITLVTVLVGIWADLVGISWFAIAPLVTSALAAELPVAVVACVAILATVFTGLRWTSLAGAQVATRTAAVTVVGVVAVVLAHQRERREQRLRSRRIVERLASFTEALAEAAST